MAWLRIGSKRLGVEFAFLAGSTVFIYLTQTYLVLPSLKEAGAGEWERLVFLFFFSYNVIVYLQLAFSDPGRIDTAH